MIINYRGKPTEVNEYNPSFNYLTGNNIPYIEVEARFGNEVREWKETINVSSLKNADKEIKEVIDFFNNTRSEYESIRKYVGLWND